jgi:hypothetical protein
MKSIIKAGTVTISPDGRVSVDGFEIDHSLETDGKESIGLSGCQSAFNIGAAWAIQQLAFSLTEEGFGKGGVD